MSQHANVCWSCGGTARLAHGGRCPECQRGLVSCTEAECAEERCDACATPWILTDYPCDEPPAWFTDRGVAEKLGGMAAYEAYHRDS